MAHVILTLNKHHSYGPGIRTIFPSSFRSPLTELITEIAPYLTQHDVDALHDAPVPIYMRLSRVRIRLEWSAEGWTA
jgi:hypothetical protein